MLTNYANNLFATRSNLNEALVQANELYASAMSTSDSIAMRTAVYVVLNTAIQQHTIEMAAVYDKHAAEVRDLRSKLAAKPDPVTALLTLVREEVREAITERDVGELIENWMADNLDQKMEDWNHENVDIDNAVEEYMRNQSIVEDLITEKIGNFFGNNTFTIEPR
jgi:hypothetical protein